MGVLNLLPTLATGRVKAGRAGIDALGVAAFTVSTGLMLTVVGGYQMFAGRESAPPAPYLESFGANTDYAAAMLPSWTFLAVGAAILLIVPMVTLAGAAARMGALGRDRRLAALREALPSYHRTDLQDLRTFFRLGGLASPLLG